MKKILLVALGLLSLLALTCQNDLLQEPKKKKKKTNEQVIEQAKEEEGRELNAVLTPPKSLTASHGKRRVIELNWEGGSGASEYILYSADSQFSEFTNVVRQFPAYKTNTTVNDNGESVSVRSTVKSISISVPAGASCYYRIVALNKEGEESIPSNIVYGTSLASPLMLIDTYDKDEKTQSCVSWYMDNCRSDTYLSQVRYEVRCYSDKEGKEEVGVKTCSGNIDNNNSVIFTGLKHGVKYYYKVMAYLATEQGEIEESDLLDSETAKTLIPEAPLSLTATQGVTTEGIILNWTLPNFTHIKDKDIYTTRPLYFTIERRELKEEEDVTGDTEEGEKDYKTLASYVGGLRSYPDNNATTSEEKLTLKSGQYQFKFNANADGSEKTDDSAECFTENRAATTKDIETKVKIKGEVKTISVKKQLYILKSATRPESVNAELNDNNYPEYITGSTLSFIDEDAALSKDKKYVYRVRSYTDDYDKTVSGRSSIARAVGYLVANATASSYTERAPSFDKDSMPENARYSTNKTILNFSFDERDNIGGYKYFIAESKGEDSEDAAKGTVYGEWKIIKSSINIHDVRKYEKEYNFLDGIGRPLADGDAGLKAMCGYYKYKICITSNIATDEEVVAALNNVQEEKDYESEEAAREELAPGGIKEVTTGKEDSTVYKIVVDASENLIDNDPTSIPTLTYFKVMDGYANKFILKWNYEPNYKYTLTYTNSGEKEGQEISIDNSTLQVADSPDPKDSTKTIKIATYTDTQGVTPGVARTYKLTASLGRKLTLNGVASCDGVGDLVTWQTLGEAKVKAGSLMFDSIIVSWDAVQKASPGAIGYEVSAKYKDPAITDKIEVKANYVKEEEGKFTCKIEKPAGYDDIKKAGLPIIVSVKAKNNETGDTTTATIEEKVLGPALVNTRAEGAYSNKINIKWSEVKGAKGYIVYRVSYKDVAGKQIDSEATNYQWSYYVRPATKDITKTGEDESINENATMDVDLIGGKEGVDIFKKEAVKVVYVNKEFSLEDKYIVSERDDNNYTQAQEKLCIGLPYGYVVLPVFESEDATCQALKVSLSNDTRGSVAYKEGGKDSLTPIIHSVLSYATNIKASKLTSKDCIEVTWDSPYLISKATGSALWRRRFNADGTGNKGIWQKVNSLGAGVKSYQDELNGVEVSEGKKEDYSYEYTVTYFDTEGRLEVEPSYDRYLSGLKDTDIRYADSALREPLNKGYCYSLSSGVSVYPAPLGETYKQEGDEEAKKLKRSLYYSEELVLPDWDYTERAIGPDTYKISIMNKNIDDKFHLVCTLSGKNSFKLNQNTNSQYDINVKSNKNILWFTPAAIDAITKMVTGETLEGKGDTLGTGLLKVLRDYKHYYKIEVESRLGEEMNSETFGVKTAGGKEAPSMFTYRNITGEELAKATTLILADVTRELNNSNTTGTLGGNFKSIGRGEGTFQWAHNAGSKFSWNIEDYIHKWDKVPSGEEQFNSFLTLTDRNTKCNGRGFKGGAYIAYLSYHDDGSSYPSYSNDSPIPITVSFVSNDIDSKIKESYEGKVGVAVKSSDKKGLVAVQSTIDPVMHLKVVRKVGSEEKTIFEKVIDETGDADLRRKEILHYAPFTIGGLTNIKITKATSEGEVETLAEADPKNCITQDEKGAAFGWWPGEVLVDSDASSKIDSYDMNLKVYKGNEEITEAITSDTQGLQLDTNTEDVELPIKVFADDKDLSEETDGVKEEVTLTILSDLDRKGCDLGQENAGKEIKVSNDNSKIEFPAGRVRGAAVKIMATWKRKVTDAKGNIKEDLFSTKEYILYINKTDSEIEKEKEEKEKEKNETKIDLNKVSGKIHTTQMSASDTAGESFNPSTTIGLIWDEVKNAKGYAVYRVPYTDIAATTLATGAAGSGKDAMKNCLTYYVEKANSDAGITSYSVKDLSSTYSKGEGVKVKYTSGAEGELGQFILNDYYIESINPSSDSSNPYLQAQRSLVTGQAFGYIVVPYENKADVSFGVSGGSITYTITDTTKPASTDAGVDNGHYKNTNANIATTIGYTTGCGLDLMASKLEYSNKIEVKWTAPYSVTKNAALTYSIYRRRFNTNPAGSTGTITKGAWQQLGNITGKVTGAAGNSYTFMDESIAEEADLYRAYEYAVCYSSFDSSSLPKGYTEDYLLGEEQKEDTSGVNVRYTYADSSKAESRNKGYMFNVMDFEARSAPLVTEHTVTLATGDTVTKRKIADYDASTHFYSECVSIGDWDYTERVLGPDTYTVSIMNLNIDSNWHALYSLDGKSSTLNITTLNSSTDTLDDVNIAQDGVNKGAVWITPKEISTKGKTAEGKTSDGTGGTGANCLLKVLRDYKHYYRLTVKSGTNSVTFGATGEEANATRIDNSSYVAYRNITAEEFSKCALLIFGAATNGLQGHWSTGTSGGFGYYSSLLGANYSDNLEFEIKQSGGTFEFAQSNICKVWFNIKDYLHKWVKTPGGVTLDAFMTLTREDKNYKEICANKTATSWCNISIGDQSRYPDFVFDKPMTLTVSSKDLPNEIKDTYSGTVSIALKACNKSGLSVGSSDAQMNLIANNGVIFTKQVKADFNSDNSVRVSEILKYAPIRMYWYNNYGKANNYASDTNEAKLYGWWPSN